MADGEPTQGLSRRVVFPLIELLSGLVHSRSTGVLNQSTLRRRRRRRLNLCPYIEPDSPHLIPGLSESVCSGKPLCSDVTEESQGPKASAGPQHHGKALLRKSPLFPHDAHPLENGLVRVDDRESVDEDQCNRRQPDRQEELPEKRSLVGV